MAPRWRRAAWLAAAALVVALLAWLASAALSATRFETDARDGALHVRTRLPSATCSKTLSADFPWVHFTCAAEGEAP